MVCQQRSAGNAWRLSGWGRHSVQCLSAVRSPTPHFTRATVPPTPTVVVLLPTREVAMAAGTSVASWAACSRHGHSEAMLIDDPTLELQLTNLLGVDESGSRSRAPVCTSNKTWEIRGDREVQ